MGFIDDLSNSELQLANKLLAQHVSEPLGLIQIQLAQVALYLARQSASVGFLIGSLVTERDAELRIGREPNGDFYVVLEIASRVEQKRQGFWEEHAVSVSRLIDAITAVSVAYHGELETSSSDEAPF